VSSIERDAKPTWTLADDLSWMWNGLMDPRTGHPRRGEFCVDLMHEFGHWVAGQHGDIGIDGLGLYGLEHSADGAIIVTLGGGVPMGSSRPRDWEYVVANVAGLVAEKLAADEAFRFDDPVGLLSTPDFIHDLDEARAHLANKGVRPDGAARVRSALSQAITEAVEIIRPLLPRLHEQVAQLETIVRAGRLSKLELEWSGTHAALLTGEDLYE